MDGWYALQEVKQIPLEMADPEIFELLQREQTRQWKGLELIASEVKYLLVT